MCCFFSSLVVRATGIARSLMWSSFTPPKESEANFDDLIFKAKSGEEKEELLFLFWLCLFFFFFVRKREQKKCLC